MRLRFNDIIDKHKDKRCLVVGHGPSLNVYKHKLGYYKDNDFTIIGCNNWNEFYEYCVPHYWINANSMDTCSKQMNLINKYKSIWIYADSVDATDHKWVEDSIKTDFLSYDQRHFNRSACDSCGHIGCDKSLDINRLTIQEELQKYTGFHMHYSTGDTVALHMLAFSIVMGFSEIFVIGLDLDYNMGYAENNTGRYALEIDNFNSDRYGSNILNDIKIISESAKNIGTKIFNLNANSKWDHFEIRDSIDI